MRIHNEWLYAAALLSAIGCGSDSFQLDDAGQHFAAAERAIGAGETAKAMEELTVSINVQPDPWAYYQRAKLYADSGNDQAALADCNAGLAIDADNESLKWLLGELNKPRKKRFKRKFAKPPIATK